MASPAVAPAPAAAPHVLPQQHDQRHYTLPHHAYTPQSGPRSSTGTLQSHLRQQSLPSHAYDQILPAKPKPAARRLDGVQTPLTEENIAALQRQSHTHILNSPPSSRKAPVRPHSPTANTRSSRGSRQSQLRDSGVGSPVRQISDTPRGLSSDPEKQEYIKNDWSSGEHYHSTYSQDDDAADPQHEPSTHSLQALLHLSFTAPFLSIAITLYTILALLFSVLASVLGLCMPKRPTFRDYTTTLLAPPLRLQLRCVYAPPSVVQARHESLARRLGPLVCTHLFAPIASLPMVFAAWTVALFWALSALIADEGSNGDGKTLSLTLGDWWVWWLEGRAFR